MGFGLGPAGAVARRGPRILARRRAAAGGVVDAGAAAVKGPGMSLVIRLFSDFV